MTKEIILLIPVILILTGTFFLKKKYQEDYLPIHQGIVNKYGSMEVRDLNNIIVKQFHYFLRNNKETPLLIKYNFIVLVPLLIVFILFDIIPIHINFFTILISIIFLPMLSLSITESYMYYKISQQYTDYFWGKYLEKSNDNILKVVVHYAYTPKKSSHLIVMWYSTFSGLVTLLYCNYISSSIWN